ncbi:MAG: PorT family protein [Muribaculaceae bacterium]|nr:PorT family protein [Muribaculaceae bacterium]MCI9055239.1 PorT family protein [Muribaculaceae bacterium]
MKRFWALALALAVIMPAMAQFRFGVRAGLNVNSLHFNKEIFDENNRAGFTGGVMAEFTVPIIGVGADLGVMYVRRNSQFMQTLADKTTEVQNLNSDYIEIPLNIKYKIGIPAISSILKPYIFTGPSFAFLTSKKHIENFVHDKTCDIAWNFGLGLEFFNHLQVGASYGLGMTKAFQAVNLAGDAAGIEGKNRYWTVTAAWLF